jgi:hypothetical protein
MTEKVPKDYDEYIVKVDRHNREGEDISRDVPGSGGRRKEDGTISTQYYDPRPFDESLYDQPRPSKVTDHEEHHEPTVGERIAVEALSAFCNAIVDIAVQTASYVIDEHVVPAVSQWWNETVKPKMKKSFSATVHPYRKTKAEMILSSHPTHGNASDAVVCSEQISTADQMISNAQSAYSAYCNNMDDEEKQRHLLKLMIHYYGLMNEIQALSGVSISESDLQKLYQFVTSPEVTASINSILEHNPALLEESQAKMLRELFRFDVIQDGVFIPIEGDKLKMAICGKNQEKAQKYDTMQGNKA